jgi:zinc transport system substrate-binding protein
MLHAARILLLAIFAAAPAAAAPKVVVSIKPLHALVGAAMEGVGEPTLLVPPTASEHSFSLRPSDARALQEADLVFWVGPQLESFLAKAIGGLPKQERVVPLAEASGVALLDLREGGAWEAHDHDHGHAHGKAKSGAARAERDMHIWLDPANAARIVAAAAEKLAATDPANAARYAQNAARAETAIAALDAELEAILAPVRARPFIVFHDAYQYLERRYRLNAVGSITVSPERKPSAKRLHAIRGKIVRSEAVCVFSEPQFDAGLVRTVIAGTPARTASLDHLGVGAPDGLSGYAEMMRGLARTLADCLRPTA